LTDYIKIFQDILDDIATQYPKAAETALVCGANMLNPYHNGGYADYQYRWGGPWGISSGVLYELDGEVTQFIMPLGYFWKEARAAGWPGYELNQGQSNVFVVAEKSPNQEPEPYAESDTWYEDDGLGFHSLGYDLTHDEKEKRFLDYAWKRHSKPDATLHARLYDAFFTDDVGGHTVRIETGESVTFAPFGHPEIRDPDTDDHVVKSATIVGLGRTTKDVLEDGKLNSGLYTHQFNREVTKNITLTVKSGPVSGAATHTKTAVIKVNVYTPFPGSADAAVEKAVPFGLRSVTPNPFNPVTSIKFGLSRQGFVRLTIYDVQGRRVKSLLDKKQLPAGLHAVVWDGTNTRGMKVASGVYFARLEGEYQSQTRKLVLIK
jgi:hypothetical protein